MFIHLITSQELNYQYITIIANHEHSLNLLQQQIHHLQNITPSPAPPPSPLKTPSEQPLELSFQLLKYEKEITSIQEKCTIYHQESQSKSHIIQQLQHSLDDSLHSLSDSHISLTALHVQLSTLQSDCQNTVTTLTRTFTEERVSLHERQEQ